MRRLNYAFVKRPLLLSCLDLLYFMLVLVFSDLVSLAFYSSAMKCQWRIVITLPGWPVARMPKFVKFINGE